jgi:flagellar hook protein FlgE
MVLTDSKHMDPSAIALQGLQQAEVQLETAASAIASGGSTSANGSNLDVVDLSAEMVALMSAQTSFSANLATLKTADQMQKNLIDLTA